ncbi:MAG: hypothetical protein H7831_18500 [Magnetococcus sp. WYHC-3]
MATGLLIAGIFLAQLWTYSHPLRYSDWSFGDAQTLIALKHWQKDGWAHHYGLGIYNQPSPVTHLLDRPELRHHALGNSPRGWMSPQRLYYSHYPPGYKIPHYWARLAGVQGTAPLRWLAVGLSTLGLLLFAWTLRLLPVPDPVIFLAVASYGLSIPCFELAGSLANQPSDDFLRFLFLSLTLLGARRETSHWILPAQALAGGLLMLSSLDSVLFCALWMVLAQHLTGQGWRWKRLFTVGGAMVAAYLLLLWQNAWYMGSLQAAVWDHFGSFLEQGLQVDMRGGPGHWDYWVDSGLDRANRLAAQWTWLLFGFQLVDLPGYESLRNSPRLIAVGVMIILTMLALVIQSNRRAAMWVLALLLCGLLYSLVFSNLSRMHYQVRQILPFFSLLTGLFWYHLVLRASPGRWRTLALLAAGGHLLLLLQAVVPSALAREHLMRRSDDSLTTAQRLDEVRTGMLLRTIPTPRDKVFFSLIPMHFIQETEWELGAPVLYFNNDRRLKRPLGITLGWRSATDKLERDLATFMALDGGAHRDRFSPVVLAPSGHVLMQARTQLARALHWDFAAIPMERLEGPGGTVIHWMDLTPLMALTLPNMPGHAVPNAPGSPLPARALAPDL